jgi:hypothetical protein
VLAVLPAGIVRAIDRASRALPRALQEICLVHMAARFRKPVQ